MNFPEMIASATHSLFFNLEHYSDCEQCGDVWGMRRARLGILNCLHVIRWAKNAGGIS